MINLLLVDDNRDFLNHLSYCLRNVKVDIILSYNVDEALNNIEQKKFDLICSDYNMGDTNGLDLLKNLRNKNNNIKFIMLTGDDNSKFQYQLEELNGIFLDKGDIGFINSIKKELFNL